MLDISIDIMYTDRVVVEWSREQLERVHKQPCQKRSFRLTVPVSKSLPPGLAAHDMHCTCAILASLEQMAEPGGGKDAHMAQEPAVANAVLPAAAEPSLQSLMFSMMRKNHTFHAEWAAQQAARANQQSAVPCDESNSDPAEDEESDHEGDDPDKGDEGELDKDGEGDDPDNAADDDSDQRAAENDDQDLDQDRPAPAEDEGDLHVDAVADDDESDACEPEPKLDRDSDCET